LHKTYAVLAYIAQLSDYFLFEFPKYMIYNVSIKELSDLIAGILL